MAKQGFSYYKAETDRFQDIKIKRLKKKSVVQGMLSISTCSTRFTG